MGFRNPQSFNLAMLAKQGWGLLSNPHSLLARIYEAKYFPHGDLLNLKLGCSPSYAWHIIFQTLEVIRKGTQWRVANGQLIHIWEEKLLLTSTTYKVFSPSIHFDDFLIVSTLIDHETRRWKPEHTWAVFLPFKADTILNMPLSYNLLEDKLI